jgi:hypothetical protein
VDAIANHDPRTGRLYFDITTVVGRDISADDATLVATCIRQLGIKQVAGNVTPYMR